MKIGFDVSQTAENKAGCGFYADQLITALTKIDRENQYLLYPTFYGYRHPDFRQAAFPRGNPNVKMLLTDTAGWEINRWWDTPQPRSRRLGNPDIIHSNNFSCPRDVDCKTVMTIHDLAFMELPDLTTEANRLVCFQGVFESSLYADFLIMVSESTRQVYQRHFPHYPAARMAVVHEGTRNSIQPQTPEYCRRLLDKLNLQADGFWLGVGTVEPRKNYRLLVRAYGERVKQYGEERLLCIAGGKGWLESDIGEFVKANGLEDKVRFLGYVTDEELSVLYTACFAFVYPSLYEGFGLPLVEAMSCGAAVITSQTTSMPEVAGDAGLLIDPCSVESLFQAMTELAGREDLRRRLQARSRERARLFSWEAAAAKVLDCYRQVMDMPSWYVRAAAPTQ
ncbi:MAG TPA: glycosyltransferase family 1 protein [Methylomusa anaerophila]|uniref:Mannosylfructose-phosphate synthase n=1 Tax=Methylomusa anaerophila TaxID=1930071 RepID=A0A348AKP3_9FIRM|nr:glycosyltransferase family 1 protein [Methylomusa anaerophila]BBB91641.1 mannosylfructose-phosphate synthase [Methylomusa anaerophila]HML88625.1 glycosyltransferase family 1 protein [Methylomusa anaerophila]